MEENHNSTDKRDDRGEDKFVNLYPWIALVNDSNIHALYDTLRGALFIVTEKEYNDLSSSILMNNTELKNILTEKKLGYLADVKVFVDQLGEVGDRLQELSSFRLPPPLLRADIVLTNICYNEYCNICQNHLLGGYYCITCLIPKSTYTYTPTPALLPKYMSFEKFVKLINYLNELDVKSVKILGGNILVKNDLNKYLDVAFSKFNETIIVLPHNTVYGRDFFDKIRSLKIYSYVDIVLTHIIDNNTINFVKEGEIHKIIDAISTIFDASKSINLCVGVVDNLSIQDFERIYQAFMKIVAEQQKIKLLIYPIITKNLEKDDSTMLLSKIAPTWLNPPNILEFTLFKKYIPCTYSSITIDPNGYIVPCKAFIGAVPSTKFDGNNVDVTLKFIIDHFWPLKNYLYKNFSLCSSCALRVACRRCQFMVDILAYKLGNCPIRRVIGSG